MRAVAPIPKNHPVLAQSVEWVNDINAAMKGKFQINYVGGPEVIPRPQLVEAARTGVIGVAVVVRSGLPRSVTDRARIHVIEAFADGRTQERFL